MENELDNTRMIPGFSNYSISLDGRVYCTEHTAMRGSKFRNDGTRDMHPRHCPTREKTVTVNRKTGYHSICAVDNDGKARTLYIHRAVMLTWADRVEGCDYVDHINGDKSDNRIENLEWVTQKENVRRSWKRKLQNEENV